MNAIILAAGMGTRLNPLTLTTPKPLIKVNDKPMVEGSIELLIEAGVTDITLVTGYLSEKFNYLKEKYAPYVTLVYNERYKDFNNIYSLYLVRDKLADSIILEADIIISRNIFKGMKPAFSYYSKKMAGKNNEWQIIEKDGRVTEIYQGGEDNYIVAGVATVDKAQSLLLKDYIKEAVEANKTSYFWDQAVGDHLDKLTVTITPLEEKDIYEIDSVADLELYNIRHAKGEI
jgi:CTP:phosphocholine cytidylyltransferase-like protein